MQGSSDAIRHRRSDRGISTRVVSQKLNSSAHLRILHNHNLQEWAAASIVWPSYAACDFVFLRTCDAIQLSPSAPGLLFQSVIAVIPEPCMPHEDLHCGQSIQYSFIAIISFGFVNPQNGQGFK